MLALELNNLAASFNGAKDVYTEVPINKGEVKLTIIYKRIAPGYLTRNDFVEATSDEKRYQEIKFGRALKYAGALLTLASVVAVFALGPFGAYALIGLGCGLALLRIGKVMENKALGIEEKDERESDDNSIAATLIS